MNMLKFVSCRPDYEIQLLPFAERSFDLLPGPSGYGYTQRSTEVATSCRGLCTSTPGHLSQFRTIMNMSSEKPPVSPFGDVKNSSLKYYSMPKSELLWTDFCTAMRPFGDVYLFVDYLPTVFGGSDGIATRISTRMGFPDLMAGLNFHWLKASFAAASIAGNRP